jgi:hypothetical protein
METTLDILLDFIKNSTDVVFGGGTKLVPLRGVALRAHQQCLVFCIKGAIVRGELLHCNFWGSDILYEMRFPLTTLGLQAALSEGQQVLSEKELVCEICHRRFFKSPGWLSAKCWRCTLIVELTSSGAILSSGMLLRHICSASPFKIECANSVKIAFGSSDEVLSMVIPKNKDKRFFPCTTEGLASLISEARVMISDFDERGACPLCPSSAFKILGLPRCSSCMISIHQKPLNAEELSLLLRHFVGEDYHSNYYGRIGNYAFALKCLRAEICLIVKGPLDSTNVDIGSRLFWMLKSQAEFKYATSEEGLASALSDLRCLFTESIDGGCRCGSRFKSPGMEMCFECMLESAFRGDACCLSSKNWHMLLRQLQSSWPLLLGGGALKPERGIWLTVVDDPSLSDEKLLRFTVNDRRFLRSSTSLMYYADSMYVKSYPMTAVNLQKLMADARSLILREERDEFCSCGVRRTAFGEHMCYVCVIESEVCM